MVRVEEIAFSREKHTGWLHSTTVSPERSFIRSLMQLLLGSAQELVHLPAAHSRCKTGHSFGDTSDLLRKVKRGRTGFLKHDKRPLQGTGVGVGED